VEEEEGLEDDDGAEDLADESDDLEEGAEEDDGGGVDDEEGGVEEEEGMEEEEGGGVDEVDDAVEEDEADGTEDEFAPSPLAVQSFSSNTSWYASIIGDGKSSVIRTRTRLIAGPLLPSVQITRSWLPLPSTLFTVHVALDGNVRLSPGPYATLFRSFCSANSAQPRAASSACALCENVCPVCSADHPRSRKDMVAAVVSVPMSNMLTRKT
jgi:hypothetical protein